MLIPRATPLSRAPCWPLRPEPFAAEKVQRLAKEREQVLDIVGIRRGWHVRPSPPYSEITAPSTWNERLLCWVRSVGEEDEGGTWEAWDTQAECWLDGPMYVKNRLATIERAERLAP